MSLKLTILLYLFLVCNISCINKTIDKETVKTLDIQRYMGKWFEIARFDYHFEHNLVGSTIEYTLLPDSTIEVVTCGYSNDFSGPCVKARGIVRVNPSDLGKMKITYLWKFYAEYNILEIDEQDYRYALVGSNTCRYLWLISRTPQLSHEKVKHLLDCAKRRGYDVSMLKWVKHKDHLPYKHKNRRLPTGH